MATKAFKRTDSDEVSVHQHCLTELPYRAVVFVRENDGTPLYQVAGSSAAALGAEKALRAAFALHKGACFYCKKPVPKDLFSIDHVEPKVLGDGSKRLQNLVVACRPCNLGKGAQPVERHSKAAGREWLSAELKRLQARLRSS